MRTKEEHIILGEVTALITSLIWSYFKKEKIEGWDWLAIFAGAYIGSILPDKIDPPTNPNHRALGHSLVGNTSLSYLLIKKSNNININSTLKWFMRSFVIAQLSHILSDSTSPKGIPFI